MAVVERWTGLETRMLRLSLRLTWEVFAERLGVGVRTVANWESRGASLKPQPEMQAALDTLLDQAGPAAQARFDVMFERSGASATAREGGEWNETEGHASQERSGQGRLGGRPSTDLVEVARLRQRVQDLDARYDHQPSASLLPEGGRLLGHVAILRSGAGSARVHRALSAVEAEAATLMGQLVWDASQRRDHATARLYLGQAIDAARQIGDRTLESYAQLRTSFVALYGEKDPRQGLDLATRAATTASGSSAAVASIAVLHVAEAHALLGEGWECEQALDAATATAARVEAMDPALDLLPAPQHDRIAGSCYLALGRSERAIATLDRAALALRAGSKSHALVLANLALAHVRGRELDGAIEALHHALDAVDANRGGGALTVLFQAGRELRPWRHGPPAEEVHDRLLALVAV